MSRYEVDVTVAAGRGLKNVNWRYGDLRPYAVVWVDPSAKCTTKVDVDGDEDPVWEEKLTIPLPGYDRRSAVDDAFLYMDVVHANGAEDVKPLVGSARVPLRDVVEEAGVGGKVFRTLKLTRPSGRPHGKVDIKICVREPSRYYDNHTPQPYGVPYGQNHSTRDYNASYNQPPPPPTGYGYNAGPTQSGYSYGAPAPSAYPYGGPSPPVPTYGGQGASNVGSGGTQSKSKFGMGTGLAVGAAAGLVGGLALVGGANYIEDKISDNVVEKLADDDDDYYDDDD